MKNNFKWWGLGIVVISAILFTISCNRDSIDMEIDSVEALAEDRDISFQSEPINGQYIVVLKKDAIPQSRVGATFEEMKEVVRAEGVRIIERGKAPMAKVEMSFGYALKGFVVSDLSEEQAKIIAKDPAVDYIEQDQTIQLMGGPPGGGGGSGGCASNNNETTPCGIPLVNGGSNYSGSRKAYVLDTGIDLTHPDLNVANYGFNAFTSGQDGSSLNDGNGHGTHVAGTIAAIGGNNIGVVGVAAGALVVPVKVLDRRGSGSVGGVIAGVDYVGANGNSGDVANMSLTGGASSALDNAVLNASSGGIWFVLAAGNNSANANNYSPARVNGPYIRTIAAMTCSSTWASYSNHGIPPVDWIAPGSSICSTNRGGGYTVMSGTSMAAPHAAGVILIRGNNPNSCGTVTFNGVAYPRICL